MSLILAAGFTTLSPPGYAQDSFKSQLSEMQAGNFEGQWVGSGRSSPISSMNRCGDGPLIELIVQAGVVTATPKFVTRKMQEIDISVNRLRGTIDDQGNMKLAGYQSKIIGILSAGKRSGEGTWESEAFSCRGSFRLRYKTSILAWPSSSEVE